MSKQSFSLTRSSVFTISSLLGGAISYALYPVLARIFSAADFGNFVVIMSMSNQALGILLAFNVITIYLVKNHAGQALEKSQTIQKVIVWTVLVIALLLVVLAPLLKNLFQSEHLVSFFFLAIIILLTVPGVIWSGFLQGHKQLTRVGIYTLTMSIGKLVFASSLAIGGGVIGGLTGVALGCILGLMTLAWRSPVELPKLRSIFTSFSNTEIKFMRSIGLYVLEVLLLVGGLSLLQGIDITFVKALFSPEVAGAYSGISILGNMLYFAAFLLIWITLPEISVESPLRNRQLLKKAYFLLASLAVCAVMGVGLFGKVVIGILLGSQFTYLSNILLFSCLFQLSLVGVILYTYYLLVIRSRRALVLGASVITPCVISPLIFSNSPKGVIVSLLVSVIVGVLVYLIISNLRVFTKHEASKATY